MPYPAHIPGTWQWSGPWLGSLRQTVKGRAWYVARCPDCDGLIWNKDCPDGNVKCSLCDLVWDIDFVKDVNEDIDFHTECMIQEFEE